MNDIELTKQQAENETLTEGLWCIACEFFETETEFSGDRCLACGCTVQYHVPAKVVERANG